jgi:hypothetical protein
MTGRQIEEDQFFLGLAEGTGTDLRTVRQPALTVSLDGRRFHLASGEEVMLMRRRAPRLVLLRLVEERLTHPGRTLSVADLLAAGWPGERVLPEAGQSRVYVAISTLRRLGLAGLLVHTGSGYLLDPGKDVRRG